MSKYSNIFYTPHIGSQTSNFRSIIYVNKCQYACSYGTSGLGYAFFEKTRILTFDQLLWHLNTVVTE